VEQYIANLSLNFADIALFSRITKRVDIFASKEVQINKRLLNKFHSRRFFSYCDTFHIHFRDEIHTHLLVEITVFAHQHIRYTYSPYLMFVQFLSDNRSVRYQLLHSRYCSTPHSFAVNDRRKKTSINSQKALINVLIERLK
jgi:hypothetical protein